MRPLVCLAPAPWNGPWNGRNQLLSRLAERGWPVIYSNGPLDLWERNGKGWADASWLHATDLNDGVVVDRPGKLFSTYAKSPAWSSAMQKLHAAHLMHQMHRVAPGDAVTVVFHPLYAHYVQLLNTGRSAYFAYDLFSKTALWSDALAEAETWLVRNCDLVVAVSSATARTISMGSNRPIEILSNGVDAEAFIAGATGPVPADLADIPHPRIGYIGRMTPKVDFRLIAEVARRKPDWHWVLVGPVLLDGSVDASDTARTKEDHAACRSLPNIHFLGLKHHTELPQYAAYMDVNTMCYRAEGGWWVAGSPLKLYEYLAAGKPIVGAPLEEILKFDHLVAIARDPGEWVEAITHALEQGGIGTVQQRQEAARQNSWGNRTDELLSWLSAIR